MTRPLVRSQLGPGVLTVGERASLADARRLLHATRRSAIAVERRGRLLGVVAADDLAAARPSLGTTLTFREIEAALAWVPVTSIMRRDLPTVVPETPLAEAGRLLRGGAAAVPVLERGRLVGLVEVTDLLGALARLDSGADDGTSRHRHRAVTSPRPS